MILFLQEASFIRCTRSVSGKWTSDVATQYPQQVNIWRGILGDYLIDPFFVDGVKYLRVLQNRFILIVHKLHVHSEDIWFQQNGCSTHSSRTATPFLQNSFLGIPLQMNIFILSII